MTKKLYLYADSPLQAQARITGINASGSQPSIRLEHTLFHAKGGGQLADRGLIGPAKVVDVRHAEEGEVDHFVDSVEGLHVNDLVAIAVEPEHRNANARLHTAGHLIAGVMAAPFRSINAVGAHHYPGECRVEFKGAADVLDRLRDELPRLLEDAIALNWAVTVLGEPEVNRSIQIGSFPAIKCGGTHLSSLAPIEHIAITNVKLKDGKIRVSYSLSKTPWEKSPSVVSRRSLMSMSDFVSNTFEGNLAAMRAKADAYHHLARLARELLQDLSLANKADEAARSYEAALYERARWHARDLALSYGLPEVAERILYEVEIDGQVLLPVDLKAAIRRWRALVLFRPSRETPV